jgi:hypothetical protein
MDRASVAADGDESISRNKNHGDYNVSVILQSLQRLRKSALKRPDRGVTREASEFFLSLLIFLFFVLGFQFVIFEHFEFIRVEGH